MMKRMGTSSGGDMAGMKDDRQIAGKRVGGGKFGLEGMTEKNLAKMSQEGQSGKGDKSQGSGSYGSGKVKGG